MFTLSGLYIAIRKTDCFILVPVTKATKSLNWDIEKLLLVNKQPQKYNHRLSTMVGVQRGDAGEALLRVPTTMILHRL